VTCHKIIIQLQHAPTYLYAYTYLYLIILLHIFFSPLATAYIYMCKFEHLNIHVFRKPLILYGLWQKKCMSIADRYIISIYILYIMMILALPFSFSEAITFWTPLKLLAVEPVSSDAPLAMTLMTASINETCYTPRTCLQILWCVW